MLTMTRPAIVLLVIALAPGCLFEHGSSPGDDVCVVTEGPPALDPPPLRDPSNLTCQSFGGGCNPACGPCPDVSARAPIPSWGLCGSICDQLGVSACAAEPGCRVVKDAGCTIGSNVCLTDFLGCFPTDTSRDDLVECFGADAWTCSRSQRCEAHHLQRPCPNGASDCARPFATCTPPGVDPGDCTGQVLCAIPPPVCPAGTTPGIANGCFTRACIENDACPAPM
jgi:hypothetical protein